MGKTVEFGPRLIHCPRCKAAALGIPPPLPNQRKHIFPWVCLVWGAINAGLAGAHFDEPLIAGALVTAAVSGVAMFAATRFMHWVAVEHQRTLEWWQATVQALDRDYDALNGMLRAERVRRGIERNKHMCMVYDWPGGNDDSKPPDAA